LVVVEESKKSCLTSSNLLEFDFSRDSFLLLSSVVLSMLVVVWEFKESCLTSSNLLEFDF